MFEATIYSRQERVFNATRALDNYLTQSHNASSITQPYCDNGQHLNVSLPSHDQTP